MIFMNLPLFIRLLPFFRLCGGIRHQSYSNTQIIFKILKAIAVTCLYRTIPSPAFIQGYFQFRTIVFLPSTFSL